MLSRDESAGPVTHRAGVVGSPIAHSLSPVLHGAAYRALGLDGWRYGRAEVGSGELAPHVAALGQEWVGLSVTMPGKEEALALADVRTRDAELTGAANTLVRCPEGWSADNTDIHGLIAALQEAGAGSGAGSSAGGTAVLLGGGATARSALVALHRLGRTRVDVVVRSDLRGPTRDLADRLADGMTIGVHRLADGLGHLPPPGILLSTLPASAPAPDLAGAELADAVVMEVAYDPWPGALARAVAAATDGRVGVVRGTRMLLHQAARQVELMTGAEAPLAAMDEALHRALDETTTGRPETDR